MPKPRRISTLPRDRLELYCVIGLWVSLIEGILLAVLAIAIYTGAVS